MSTAAAAGGRDLVGKKLGRYEILSQLASGGMATVYVARSQGVAGFERLAAIKVLHPHLAHDDEFISMFLDEARLAARIRHPNVVPTLDISDSAGDGYFLVMEYIEGDHFGALLREAARGGKRLPPGVSLRIVLDALEGLAAAHALADGDGRALGIVHRDISPHNILLGVDGIARITDFGVAKAEVRLSSTRDGQFKGKLSYMAPEQASSGFADQRSDLFSMAIVAWEALTAKRLFRADNNGELLNRVLHATIPAPSEFDPALAPVDPVILKALERDPAKRYQSAGEFIDAIEQAGANLIATGQSGIAGPRQVARSVREWLGPKIDDEQGRIRVAIESLGKSELTSPGKIVRPDPSGLTPTPSNVRLAPLAAGDETVAAKPSTLQQPEAPPRRPPVLALAVAGGAALLLLGVVGAWALGAFGGSAPAAVEPASPAAIAAPSSAAPTAAPTAAPVPAAPAEPVPAPAEAEPAAVEAASEAPAEPVVVEAEGARSGRTRRRTPEGSEASAASGGTTTSAATATPPTAPPSPPPARRSDDDEELFLSNPYRN